MAVREDSATDLSGGAVSAVAAAMRETAWRQYVEAMAASHYIGGLAQLPDALAWPAEAIAERAAAIAKLTADRICR